MLSALGDIKVYTFIRTTYNKKYEKQNLSVDHWHDFYQLVYARKGNGAVIIDGEELPLSENDVVLIAPGQRHFLRHILKNSKPMRLNSAFYRLKTCR